MKKLLIAVLSSLLTFSTVLAEENTSSPDKYELGQYNFNFSNEETTTTNQTELPQVKVYPAINQNVSEEKIKPISKKMPAQKDVIEKVKQEEATAKENIKQDFSNLKDKTKTDVQKASEKVDVSKNKTENAVKNELQKTEKTLEKAKDKTENAIKREINQTEQSFDKAKQQINQRQKSNITPQERPVKFDKDRPPVRFQIRQIQYEGKSQTTFERL